MAVVPETRYSLLQRIGDPTDDASWREFAGLYEPVVYRLARRFGLQDADARDLTQDVLAAVMDAVRRWEPDAQRGRFRTWLYALVRNKTIDAMRRRRRIPDNRSDSGLLNGLPATPAEEAFPLEVRRAAFLHAAELVRPQVLPQTWQAFWETSVAGHSVEDTARGLNLSVGSVYAARSRILARLRTEIERLLGDEL